jgi:hypothetical protein
VFVRSGQQNMDHNNKRKKKGMKEATKTPFV